MICQRAFSVVFLLFKEVASENSFSWLHGTWQWLSQTLWYSGIPQPVSSRQILAFTVRLVLCGSPYTGTRILQP